MVLMEQDIVVYFKFTAIFGDIYELVNIDVLGRAVLKTGKYNRQ